MPRRLNEYTLNARTLGILIAKKRQHYSQMQAQNLEIYAHLFNGKELFCRQCELPLQIGDEVVSKPFGRSTSATYHRACAIRLCIV